MTMTFNQDAAEQQLGCLTSHHIHGWFASTPHVSARVQSDLALPLDATKYHTLHL